MTNPPRRSSVFVIALLCAGLLGVGAWAWRTGVKPRAGLVMVVMDPLSRKLACACVKGYAQRDYDRLASHLSGRLGLPVKAVYADALDKALRIEPAEHVALIVGKHSVVKADARLAAWPVQPIARLTGSDGVTTLTGLFIVRRDDPAHSLGDLKGRPILLGPADSDEKHAAALAALKVAGVAPPVKFETRSACTDAPRAALPPTPAHPSSWADRLSGAPLDYMRWIWRNI